MNANLGNLVTANNFATNGTGGDITLTGGNVQGANVTFSNSFTSNGGTVDFNTNNANVLLGSNANVHLYGGTNGQVLVTDGNGNLSWTSAANVNEIMNGYSNVSIPVANGNIYINANAGTDYQWNFDTTGNLNIPQGGYVASGNAVLELSNTSSAWLTPNVNADLTGLYMVDNDTAELYAYSNVSIYSNEAVAPYEWKFDNTGNLVLPNNSVGYATITAQAANNISIRTGGANYSQVILNDGGDVIIYGNAQTAEYVFGANGTFSVGSGTTIDFNTNGANVQLGSNTNVHIYGGSSGQVLQTDGAGNLNWYSISATEIVNGNSNVTIPTTNDNVYIYTNGTYEWIFDATGNTTFPAIGTANLGNLVTANYFYANADANIAGNLTVQSNANIVGNLTAGNIIGIFANGTSNVAIPVVNGNINLSVGGNANVLTVAATGANVIGTFYANGNITTTSTFVGNTITSTGTYLTIASDQDANGTYNINLVPGGAGNVDVHSTNITSLADPVNPQDAATKQYVDNISQGLYVHSAANLLASSNLNATYNNGGTSLTVTDIIGNSVVQFSAAHGLTIGNSISFTNSFNGINGNPDVYYVASVPAPNQITLKDEYFGPSPVETLIAGSGLTQPALGSPGVGATLTNAGTNAALVVDSVTTTVGLRVLVTGQTTQAYNGVYDVTTAGNVSTPWVMTRSTDGDQYIPQSANGLCGGSYFFVTEGAVYGGSSWIVTTAGEIDIGVSNVAFVQFSQGGAYTGANGISVIGTQITANVDNVTTAIIGGNIAVAANAQLVTPNIGDATGTSLNLTGNLLAGNVNSNAATITNTLTVNTYANVGNLITVGYGNIGTDLIVGGNANITGNVQIGTGSGGNITGVNYISANYANIANDVTANGNVTALSGNIAADAFYGNSITINNGGNANITGNLTANYIFANYDANISGNANVTLAINGNTANFSGNVFVGNSSSNVNITTDGNVTATGTVNAYYANVGNSITLGNTAVYWATVTTSTIAANQTVAQIPIANITGVEFFIKGVDQNGVANKYSAATVMAVTDGTNADFVIYGTTFIGATTGGLAVNIVGSNIALQVSPASTNSTVWTTQFRTI